MFTPPRADARQDLATTGAPGLATLPDVLARAAGPTRDRGAPGRITCVGAVGGTVTRSYRELCQEAERVLAGLRRLGLRPGDPVILQLDDNADYLTAFWACVLGGFIAAPLTPPRSGRGSGLATARLRAAWELCGHPLVIAGPEAAAEPGLLGCLRPGMPEPRLANMDSLRSAADAPGGSGWHISSPDDVFVLLFTSGSTGTPKAASLTHRNVLTMIRGYIEVEGLGEQEASFNWMPLEHAGGLLAFHLRDVYLGCDQVHASPATVLADPLRWLDWLDRFRATCTWAPNFAFSLINDQLSQLSMSGLSQPSMSGGIESPGQTELAGRCWDLSRLHHIMTAGEMIVPTTVRRFLSLLAEHGLPPTALHPSWGMSETSGGVTFSSTFRLEPAEGEGRFVDLGGPIPGAALRVVDDVGNVLPDGKPGRILVTGPTVTPGYFRNPVANEAAFAEDGWFDTGDIGVLREGRLTMTGRAKDIIIVNGLNYYSHEIEAAVEEVPGVVVTCTAACAVRAGGDTDELAIFYCTELREVQAVAEQWDTIRRQVTMGTGISPRYLLPVDAGAIPRTETGKIRRQKLRQLFDQGAFDAARARSDEVAAAVAHRAGPPAGRAGQDGNPAQDGSPAQEGKEEQALLEIWQSVLGREHVTIHDDFFDLGGDSVASVRIMSLARGAGLLITQDDIMASRTITQLAVIAREESDPGNIRSG